MTSPASRPRVRDHLTVVEIDGESVVYDGRSGQLHHLNPSATIVLGMCDGSATVEEMVVSVSEAFGVEHDTVAAQVRSALDRLGEAGIVV